MGYWRASTGRQPRAVDPGPIWRAGKAQGLSDEEIWADYDEAQNDRWQSHDRGLPVRLRLVRRPAQRRQVHAHQRAGRPEGRDHLRQAADHPDRGARHRAPPGRPAGARRHPRAAPAADPARRAAQRPGAHDLGRGRRGRGLLPGRREDRAGRPVHRHRAGQGAADHQGRGRHQDRPGDARADRRAPARHPARSARRPAPSGPRSSRSRRSPATRSSCSPTCWSACCRRARSSTPTATSPTRPRRSWSPS